MKLPDVDSLMAFHDRHLVADVAEQEGGDPLRAAIADNHRCNRLLWNAEDQARRPDVAADYIVECKRAIDRYNQQRNDAVERIDELLARQLAEVKLADGARLHSETPGAIIDRLSILSLKIHHMRLQAERSGASTSHIDTCLSKWQVLREQRADLADCLSHLLRGLSLGDTRFKLYRQFKMYNDPALNPWLRGQPAA